jgi:hypothetical protein
MEKTWVIADKTGRNILSKVFKTYEEAETNAKRFTKDYGDLGIFGLEASTKQPVPAIEVVKVS